MTLLCTRLPLLALTASLTLGMAPPSEDNSDVTLLPGPVVAQADAPPSMKNKLADLANVDPVAILPVSAAESMQTMGDIQALSLFGREDLIAERSSNYHANGCAALIDGGDVLDEIARRAKLTRIVIVNESHERSEHRGFTAEVAALLRPLGYDIFAAETFSNPEPGQQGFLPSFITQPGQAYLSDGDGYYTTEAGYGRLTRRVKALGYRLLPFEITFDKLTKIKGGRDEQVAVREEEEATNLAAIIKANANAKLLVHVGYSHAAETPRKNGERWMAARLKAKTGIDPLTISQTTCRGGGATRRLAALPADEPAGTFDLVVDHPTATFVRGRPTWRQRAGDRVVTIPAELRPSSGWRVIEARPVGEPVTSIPMDRVAIRADEDVALMLPPGRYQLRAIDVPYVKPAA
ncbi:hypothetical protein [Sphingomonas sp. Mn802worker]|uniref:hypothetical protein n=1 Tax=Sphingomonas sp. Mn802worker TaxID=629773 RepID=UPI0003663C21|nr:hypothetical protein [Sphingomonas sp. Mn802worker]